MRGRSPLVWLSLGLVSVTVSLVLLSNALFHVAPDEAQQMYQYRKALAESLAGQFSRLAQDGNLAAITEAMRVLAERDATIQSVALRQGMREFVAQVGDHRRYWLLPPGDGSTLDQIRVPILKGPDRWGTLELAFRPAVVGGVGGWLRSAWVQFLGALAGLGFVGYWIFMRRTLRQLDPSAVVPQRVRAALDVLTEGIVLIDPSDVIVLANRSFAARVGLDAQSLLGRDLCGLAWIATRHAPLPERFPWTASIADRQIRVSVALGFRASDQTERLLLCNCSPIRDDRGMVRGALASFSDVTELEQANEQLLEALKDLNVSKQDVLRKNEELHWLATRDPLTGCFNRRAFFEQVETLVARSVERRATLGVVMVDIDHFKLFNDRHGHAVGDQVLTAVAKTIQSVLRQEDVLGRYGGEEFCVVLNDVTAALLNEIAERIRRRIENESGASVRSIKGLSVTASLGVTLSLVESAPDIQTLLGEADQALYEAKGSGRNRVCVFRSKDVSSAAA
ncbi:sensor domain-containing diguanylate cyclase [Nitrospira lenta]|uniref:diguanylate cyclase n=1 Tax=Nitrospira lenta TaxID=1436998 RepID=A0A330LA34_9BACT|nr:diguanylate cyclase [Nitrospira lenta]SPP65951.1 putative Diguanylate cyclase [Nitrospira lenta]